jgi:hypothetical protein
VGRKRTKLRIGDKVLYTIPGGRLQDVEHEWEITSMFSVVGGTMACLSRTYIDDESPKKKIDRCNAEIDSLQLID